MSEQVKRVARAHFIHCHPHPIDVAGLRNNNIRHVILVRPLKLRRTPPLPGLVERYRAGRGITFENCEAHWRNLSMTGICNTSLAAVPSKDVFFK